jgi:hypothetical protein
MSVWYVDIPKNDPRIAQYMGDAKNGIAPSSRFEIPADLAAKIKQLNKATPAATPAATPVAQTTAAQKAADNYKAAGGAKQKKASAFVKKLKEWKDAYSRNQGLVSFLFGKGQNIFSFDDAFSNMIRRELFAAQAKGDMTMEQVKLAIRRTSLTQALFRSDIARRFMSMGKLNYDATTNRWTAEADAVNMDALNDKIRGLAARLGVDINTALEYAHKAFEANRINSYFKDLSDTKGDITRTDKRIAQLKREKKTKATEKELALKQALLKELKAKEERLTGIVRHMDRKQAQAGVKLLNENPEIKEGLDIWNEMRARTIKILVDTGVKTEDQAQAWLDEAAYVPFFRDIEQEKLSGPVVMQRGIRESMGDFGIEGSLRPVENTIQNMHEWMQWSVARAISNKQLQVMLDSYKKVLPEEVKEGEGKSGSTFTIYQDGVKRKYNVADPATAQAFIGVESILFPGIGAAMRYKNAFSHIITRFPLFPVAQLIFKDTYEAMYTSGLKHPFGVLKQIPLEIMRTYSGTSEAREALKASGTLSTHEYGALTDADDAVKKLSLEKPGRYRSTMNMLDRFAALNDNMLRQAVYAQAIKEGNPHDEAMERAVEIFNFRRLSGSPVLQLVSSITPFYNAFAQVNRVALKTLGGTGVSPQTRAEGLTNLVATSAKIGALTLMYCMAVSDSDEYRNKNRMARDASFLIPGTNASVPIRTGVFALPKLFAEYSYNLLMNSAFTDAKMAKTAMANALKKQVEPPAGGLIVPAIGLVTNHDFFHDREIVNPTMRKWDPAEQYTKSTSELAKVIGAQSNTSPAKWDYVLNSYFGSMMTLTALATNDLIASARGTPRPAKSFTEIVGGLPSMGGFVGKEEAANAVADFYQLASEMNMVIDTAKRMAQSRPEEARAYLDKNRDKLVYVEGISQALQALNRNENAILNATNKTSEQKRVEIKKIEADRRALTEAIYKQRKAAGY